MADLVYPLGSWFASWAHPIWLLDAGTARSAGTTECVQALLDGGSWGVATGHGYDGGVTFRADARVEQGGGAQLYQSWRSLQNANLGHLPVSNPAWWETVDDGLGADDASWISIPGTNRPTRLAADSTWGLHFYWHSASVASMRWATAYSGGQWAIGSGGAGPCGPAVRMSASGDTCYYAVGSSGSDEGGEWVAADLYRVVAGASTLIGQSSKYNLRGANQTWMVYAVGSTVGVAFGTAEPLASFNRPAYPQAPTASEILVEVTDTAISEATGPYVGVRYTGAGAWFHELYGGSFNPPPTATASFVDAGQSTLSGTRAQGTTIAIGVL